MQKLLSIHHLRGVAAVSVLLFHAVAFVSGYGSHQISQDMVRIGEGGVDIFFVISGFILTLVTQSPHGRSEFILGRLARVGVPYWCIILALAAMTLLAPAAFRNFAWHGSDLLLSLGFVPSIIRDGSIFPLLEPGWTLSLEMLFYMLLAVTLGLAPRSRSLAVCVMLCGLATFGLALGLPQGKSAGWFFTQAILVEFCFGILIAELYLSERRIGAKLAATLLAFGIAGFAAAAFDPPAAFAPMRLVIYGVPATFVVGGAVFLESAGLWLRSVVMTFLGTISYSLYLTHVLVLAVVVKLLSGRLGDLGGDVMMLFAATAAAICAAYMFYHLVERPALRLSSAVQARMREARSAPVLLDQAPAI